MAHLTARQRAILEYAEKLSKTPSAMMEGDVEALRSHGLDDEEILGVILVAGFFQLATRIADATGIELDRQLTRGTEEYQAYFG